MVMNIKEKVNQAIGLMGKKHFTRYLKKDIEFINFVNDNTPSTLSFIEKITLLYHSTNHLCERGNRKKFISLENGFGFCGKTGKCQCAKEHVSIQVSKKKSEYSEKTREEINQKRMKTNLQLYGVSNVGQTKKAKLKHSEYYSEASNIEKASEKYKKTMLQKYGVNNGFNTEKANYFRENNNPFNDIEVRQKGIDLRKERAKLGVYLADSYDKIREKILTEFDIDFITQKNDYQGVSNNIYYDFICQKCSHKFSTWLNNGHDPICKICNPTLISYISKEEKELADWIESQNILVERHNKTLINPYELDMIIHDKKIAIEYCGLYWHSQYRGGKLPNYHKEKMRKVNEKGYRLITVFSDEWNLQKDKVKRVLSYNLNINSEKINGRQCEVKIITKEDEQAFLNAHHLQNYIKSEIAYGIFYKNDLKGVMTFGKNRVILNRTPIQDEWEIRRIAFSANVRGGASKLMAAFVKEYKPKKIFSDTDLRWSEGNIYKILGMRELSESSANYWYVKNYSERIHRLNLTKGKLVRMGFDNSKTEREITQELGYDIIWDCGIKRFVCEY